MSAYPSWTVPTTQQFCSRSGKEHAQIRRAVPGTQLCELCHDSFQLTLRSIIEVWPALRASVFSTPRRDPDAPRPSNGGSKPDAGSRWNPSATQVIRDVADWAGSLYRTVQQDRWDVPFWGWPRDRGLPLSLVDDVAGGRVLDQPIVPEQLVPVALGDLRRSHARWLTRHPQLGASFVVDALAHWRSIDFAFRTVPVERVVLDGYRCMQTIAETELGPIRCDGQLIAVMRLSGHHDERSTIVCSNNPRQHVLLATEWRSLDRAL